MKKNIFYFLLTLSILLYLNSSSAYCEDWNWEKLDTQTALCVAELDKLKAINGSDININKDAQRVIEQFFGTEPIFDITKDHSWWSNSCSDFITRFHSLTAKFFHFNPPVPAEDVGPFLTNTISSVMGTFCLGDYGLVVQDSEESVFGDSLEQLNCFRMVDLLTTYNDIFDLKNQDTFKALLGPTFTGQGVPVSVYLSADNVQSVLLEQSDNFFSGPMYHSIESLKSSHTCISREDAEALNIHQNLSH